MKGENDVMAIGNKTVNRAVILDEEDEELEEEYADVEAIKKELEEKEYAELERCVKEHEATVNERIRTEYKIEIGVSQDYKITEDDIHEYTIRKLCAFHNWLPEQVLSAITEK